MSTKLAKRDSEFSEVLGIIRAGWARAYEVVNVALIETYWAVGAHLSRKVAEASWGKGIVKELADWLGTQAPVLKGFSASNLWRMKQFYDPYREDAKLAPLVRVLPWPHNPLILGQSERPEEREFYLRMAVQAKWSKPKLDACRRIYLFGINVSNNTLQGYARKRILKLGGSFFCAEGLQ